MRQKFAVYHRKFTILDILDIVKNESDSLLEKLEKRSQFNFLKAKEI